MLLETPRLILRRLTSDDVDDLVTLDSDPKVMQYINGGVPSTREAIAEEFLPYAMSYYSRGENLGFWAIIEQKSDDFIGWIFLRPEIDFKLLQQLNLAEQDAVELGYRLRRSSWNKGYMTEAARALINKTAKSQIVKINAWALIENKASTKVMEKVGLTLQQEYVVKANAIADKQLLTNPLVRNLLDRTVVKYQSNNAV